MAKEFSRADRVADAVKRILARLIPQELNDPRVGMVNVNDVVVTRDLAIARIYITLIGCDEEPRCQSAASALNNASGYLRTFLAKELTLRAIPKLQFFYDHTPLRGQQLSSLIDQAVAEDQAKHAED